MMVLKKSLHYGKRCEGLKKHLASSKAVFICSIVAPHLFMAHKTQWEVHLCFQMPSSSYMLRVMVSSWHLDLWSGDSRVTWVKSIPSFFIMFLCVKLPLWSDFEPQHWLGCGVLPQVQIFCLCEAWVFADLPVGSVGKPHLSASLIQSFPVVINKTCFVLRVITLKKM